MYANNVYNNVVILNEMQVFKTLTRCKTKANFIKKKKKKKKRRSELFAKCIQRNIVIDYISWLGLWQFNLCRLFNAKSIFMSIISSISNNLV